MLMLRRSGGEDDGEDEDEARTTTSTRTTTGTTMPDARAAATGLLGARRPFLARPDLF